MFQPCAASPQLLTPAPACWPIPLFAAAQRAALQLLRFKLPERHASTDLRRPLLPLLLRKLLCRQGQLRVG